MTANGPAKSAAGLAVVLMLGNSTAALVHAWPSADVEYSTRCPAVSSSRGAFFHDSTNVPLKYAIMAAWLYMPSASSRGRYTPTSVTPGILLYPASGSLASGLGAVQYGACAGGGGAGGAGPGAAGQPATAPTTQPEDVWPFLVPPQEAAPDRKQWWLECSLNVHWRQPAPARRRQVGAAPCHWPRLTVGRAGAGTVRGRQR